ncbi:MAG: phosphoglycolate phosphatase [Alphaproteobacteria bacterium]
MAKKLSGVIFDLDGTLVDSAPDIRNALNEYLRALGRRALTLEEATGMIGDGVMLLVERALTTTGEKPGDIIPHVQSFMKIYRAINADPAQIYPGVMKILDFMRERNIALGLCTNKPEAATHKLLDDLKLAAYFSGVAGGDTYPLHKPNPEHLRGVIAMMGVDADRCVMVGDSPNDLAAARGLGVPCVLADYGYASVKDLPADAFIESMEGLPEALVRLGFEFG